MILDVADSISVSAYTDYVYAELPKLTFELDMNPLEMGPSILNEKVAIARSMVNRCERFNLELAEAISKIKRKIRNLDASLELQSNSLYVSDKEVRAGRSEKERQAIISVKLKDLIVDLQGAKSTLEELDYLHITVKSVRSNLKDSEQRLKDQIQLCYQEIKNGGMWGGINIPDNPEPKSGFRIDRGIIEGSARNFKPTRNKLFFPDEPFDIEAELSSTSVEESPQVVSQDPIENQLSQDSDVDPDFKNIFDSL
jgi:hypothetical protein